MTGPCEWPIAYSTAEGCGCEPIETLDPETREAIEQMAVELLWSWTGRRLGLCETTVRPCRYECLDNFGSTFWGGAPRALVPRVAGWVPALIRGEWFNVGCGTCPGECSCAPDRLTSIQLPGRVESITRIVISGEVLSPSAYALRDGVLYRTDGGSWPFCQDAAADPEKPGSDAWEVRYRKGYPVPKSGQLAAAKLACELARAACNDEDCALPQRVQSVTRQGVSVAVLDSFEDVQDGRTGIWLIDSWVASQNAPRTPRPQVFSPDLRPERGTERGRFQGRLR